MPETTFQYQSVLRRTCFAVLITLGSTWILCIAFVVLVKAQDSSTISSVRKPALKKKLLYTNTLTLKGVNAFLPGDLLADLQTKTNTTFFGFLKPFVGFYRFFTKILPDSTGIQVGRTLGEAPIVFSERDLQSDMVRIGEIYRNSGYFKAIVNAEVTPTYSFIPELVPDDSSYVDILLRVTEGLPTRLDRLTYFGIDSLDAELIKDIRGNPLIRPGDIYNVRAVISERQRLTQLLKNFGYYFTSSDSIRAVIDTMDYHAGISFFIKASERYKFGSVSVVVHDPEISDSLAEQLGLVDTATIDRVRLKVYGDERISKLFLLRSVSYRAEEQSSEQNRIETFRRFGASGVFAGIGIRYDSVNANHIHTTIDLTPAEPHQIKPEAKLDNRNGAVFLSSGLSYLNRNLFGGGQSLNLSASLGFQVTRNSAIDRNLDSLSRSGVRQRNFFQEIPFFLDVGYDLTLPYFTSPRSRLIISQKYSFNQLPTLLRLQNTSFRLRAQYKPNDFQNINFDMVDLELINIDSLRGVSDLLRITGANADTIGNQLNSLFRSRRLTQSLRFEFTFTNLSETQRSVDARWSVLLEDAGLVVSLLDKYVDRQQRDVLNTFGGEIWGLPYVQYRKVTTTLSLAKFFNREVEWAGKLTLGYMGTYGSASETPFERRFYAGGPNSIRAFGFNSLGPGRNASVTLSQFGADIKIEGSIEWRYWFFKTLGQRSGFVVFTDIGNIWDRAGSNSLRGDNVLSTAAWGAGYGFRIGTPIGPLRLDFAYRIHDPTLPFNDRWQIRKWRLTNFSFNFGIGEAF
jgi:outer membrane protein insertion porin family